MIKKLYASAWILAITALLVSILTGNFNGAAMVVFSLIVLGLFYAFALWSVTVNTRHSLIAVPQTLANQKN